jgi:hypothetical protein
MAKHEEPKNPARDDGHKPGTPPPPREPGKHEKK